MAHAFAYDDVDPEAALKYAVQIMDERAEVVEGRFVLVSPTWDHENLVDLIRNQLYQRVRELGCRMGSGNLDLPRSSNWYVPDLAVVPSELAKGGGALLPDQTLLIVEVTSKSNGDTDRKVKRERYAQYGAPLYLLADRQERSWTLYSDPHDLGFAEQDGPHLFGTPIVLPDPFGITVDTSDF